MPSRPHDRQGRTPAHGRAPSPARLGPRQLRIIGGQWRGRRWRFPAADIRPTPDRVRETLFNWLQRRVVGAQCLDLFAGSGALGLEALSRGAARAVFVERDRAAAQALRATLARWQTPLQWQTPAPRRTPAQSQGSGAENREAQVHCTEAVRYLRTALEAVPAAAAVPGTEAVPAAVAFDLVFLDPPYAALAEFGEVTTLLAGGLLRPGSLVYVEHARRDALPPLPADWRELRAGTAGEVGYHLFEAAGLSEAAGQGGR
jgi:16S rRNA (guanine966-N2)-methyltransferase